MPLTTWEVAFATVTACTAWICLISWVPIVKYIAYAFLTGLGAGLGLIAWLTLTTARRKTSTISGKQAEAIRGPAFSRRKSWIQKFEDSANTGILNKDRIYGPWPTLSGKVDLLLETLLRSRISSWYVHISRSSSFVDNVDSVIRSAIITIIAKVVPQDLIALLVLRLVPIITQHLRDCYEAERIVRGISLNRPVTESAELDLAITNKYRDGKLHPAAALQQADLQIAQQDHVRKLTVRILPQVIPAQILKSRAVLVLITDIVSCAILAPILQTLADPDSINQLLEKYGKSMIQDRRTVRKLRAALDEHASPNSKSSVNRPLLRLAKGDDERKFERFVRAIQKCDDVSEARRHRNEIASQLKRAADDEDGTDEVYLRRLENGKSLLDAKISRLTAISHARSGKVVTTTANSGSNLPRPFTISLREVLYDAAGLSYLMEFMDRRNCMTLVQFWIVVDGFKNPLEVEPLNDDPFGGAQSTWTKSDFVELAQIRDQYLNKIELDTNEDAKATIQSFLKSGESASSAQYAQARASVLKLQSAVFAELESKHFPDFKKSDLFYKYLATSPAVAQSQPKIQGRTAKSPDVPSIPESPSRPPPLSRLLSGPDVKGSSPLRRNASSVTDLRSHTLQSFDGAPEGRRSLDVGPSKPLFDDDIEDDRLADSIHSLDSAELSASANREKAVNAVERAFTNIMTDKDDEFTQSDHLTSAASGPQFGRSIDGTSLQANAKDGDKSSELINDKDKERPNLASLGLVNTSSRIGVFSDDDLFGEEEKFLEDEHVDATNSADENSPDDDEIHEAQPGDLGLAEAIAALSADIDRLTAQDSVVDTLTRKADLTNNLAELRILGKSKSSLQREIRRKEMQRQQYMVQESDHSLYGQAEVRIKSVVVGRENDSQEFALYVIEVRRQAGEHKTAATWAVARRYSEFHNLHRRLRVHFTEVRNLEFPRRRLVMKLQRDFLRKRRIALETYLRQLLQSPAVCRSRALRAFLSQSAIVSTVGTTREGERKDIVSRIYNSVTDGMDEFMGNVPVLDQLSVAGQNLISAATWQFNTMTAMQDEQSSTMASNNTIHSKNNDDDTTAYPLALEDPIQTVEARAELLAYDPNTTLPRTAELQRQHQVAFVKPICDLFLETFDLQRGNNWLRGRAVVIVLHQLLGGAVERRIRDMVKSMMTEEKAVEYVAALQDTLCPSATIKNHDKGKENQQEDEKDIIGRNEPYTENLTPPRTEIEKSKTKANVAVMLSTLIPDMAGNVVGKANAQSAARRITATFNNARLNQHLVYSLVDEIVDALFD